MVSISWKVKSAIVILSLLTVIDIQNVNALTVNQTVYENYNIRRSYIVCNYMFDLSKHNPTLKDFLIAGQSCPNGKVSIVEIKIAENLNGNLTREYRELLEPKKLSSFPTLDLKYIYRSSINTNNPSAENKTVL